MSSKPTYIVFGEPIEILVESRSTNWTCVVGRQTSPPGGGPPPHRHEREEEIFTVVSGEFEFFDGHQWTSFHQGEVRCSTRGHYHAFRNSGTEAGQMMFMTNSGGLDEYFSAISSLELPRDLGRINEISRFYGYFFLP